jgi:hypothetical protein
MRNGAGCQRYKASFHRYDREEVINPGGFLPSSCGLRLPRVTRYSHLNGIVLRSAFPETVVDYTDASTLMLDGEELLTMAYRGPDLPRDVQGMRFPSGESLGERSGRNFRALSP